MNNLEHYLTKKISAKEIVSTPFPHFIIENFLPNDVLNKYLANFPKKSIIKNGVSTSKNRKNIMHEENSSEKFYIDNQSFVNISLDIENILLKHVSYKYKDFVDFDINELNKDLFIRRDICLAENGYKRSPHIDREYHFVINFLYLNDPYTDDSKGGELILHEFKDSYKNTNLCNDKFPEISSLKNIVSIKPKKNLFVSFLRNNNSYHSVPEMRKFENTRKFIFFGIDSRYDIWDKKDTRSEDRFKKFLSE